MDKKLCLGCMEYIDIEKELCQCGFNEKEYESEPHHLKPGTMLRERYQVGKVMGEGGFGITYVGRDTVLDLKVAIKEFYMSGYVNRNNTFSTVVRASIGSNAELFEKNREKFLSEARVLAKFANEEGIVGIRDFFEENNTAYIVMDFLTGETLRDFLKKSGKISWDKTLQIMQPVLKSLNSVHNHNVIHRDISPDNIMLTNDGKVKLLDFGAAREVSKTDIKSLSVILKPGYAPEEQYRSKGMQGPWTDIYALCATMYCCITGMVPEDSMERMFEDKLIPPCEVEPSCNKAVSRVIMKGMAVRQNERYASIAELQADLDKAVSNPDDNTIATGFAKTNTVGANVETAQTAKSVQVDENATVYAEEIVEKVVEKKEEKKESPSVQENISKKEPEKKSTDKPVKVTDSKKEIKKQSEEPSVQPVKEKSASEKVSLSKETPIKPEKEKRPINKVYIILGIVAAALLILIVGVGSMFGGRTSTRQEITPVPEALQKYEITLNGTTITLPATYQDFVNAGWEAKDPAAFAKEELPANYRSSLSIELVNVEKGFGRIKVYFDNPSSSVRTLEEGYIYGVLVDDYALNEGSYETSEPNAVAINEDLVLGTTSKEYFVENYSNYANTESSYIYGSYSQNQEIDGTPINGYYNFRFSNDVLSQINIECHNEASDFEDTYEENAPEYDVEKFAQQAGMNSKVVLTRAQENNYTITTSVKVQDYLDAGWTLDHGEGYLAAKKSSAVILRMDARTTFTATVVNPYDDAVITEECMVSDIRFMTDGLLSDDTWNLILNGEDVIDSTITQSELLNYLDTNGIYYTSEDSIVKVSPYGEGDSRKVTIQFFADGEMYYVKYESQDAIKNFFDAE